MLLSIVIVNYNGKKYLSDCLLSIPTVCKEFSYEIILIDNLSTDDSVSFVKENFREVRIIVNQSNLGFSKANNIAVKTALGEFILLLNNDTVLNSNLAALFPLFQNNPSTGIVGIKMLGRKREYRQSAGHFPNMFRLLKISFLYKGSKGFKDGSMKDEIYFVDWIEGSFLLTKKSIWDKIGGMNEALFMYGEDVDFCKRVHDEGFKTIYCSSLSYTHFGGYTDSMAGRIYTGLKLYNETHLSMIHRVFANSSLKINELLKWLRVHFKGL